MLPERPMLAARHAYFTGRLSRAAFTEAMAEYNDWVEVHGASCGAAGASCLPDVPEYDEGGVLAELPPTAGWVLAEPPDVGLGTPDAAARLATLAAAGAERLTPLQQRWANAEQMASLGRHLVQRAQQAHAEVVHELTDHTALQLTEVAQLLGVPYAEVRRAYHRGLGATCSPG